MKKFLILLAGGIFLSAWLSACTEQSPLETQPQVAPSVQDATTPAGTPIQGWGQSPESSVPFVKHYAVPYKLRGLANLELAVNGGFESGDFTGWTVHAEGDGFNGLPENVWYVGNSASLIGPPFEFDEEGNIIGGTELHGELIQYAGTAGASAINNGPTYAALYQDVTLPSVGLIELKYAIRWKNFYGEWLTPDVLVPELYNQGMDVVVTVRDPVTDAILATLFQASTESAPLFSGGGDATTAPYEVRTADISAYAGQAVRLKFENYAALFFQVVDIDAVEIVLLTPEVPALASLSDGAADVSTSPTLSWNASPGAASYGLQVSTDPSFTTTVVNESGITDLSYAVSGLANNTLYYWRANATNGGGTSLFSGAWSFTTIVAPPAAPALASPLDGATDVSNNPTLSWNASSGATSYQLQVSTSPSFTTTVVDQSGLTDLSYAVSGLADDTRYYWQVNATNVGGTSSYSTRWSFTTSAPSTGPLQVSIDIIPRSRRNLIDLKSKESIPVAILSTADFDATTVNGRTVLFAGASPEHRKGQLKDVDGDGDLDWLGMFEIRETNIQKKDTSATLTGKTKTGQDFQGSDSIQIVRERSKDHDGRDHDGKDHDGRDHDGKDHDKDKGKDNDRDKDKDKNKGGRG